MQIQMTSVKWFGIWFRFARVVDNGSDAGGGGEGDRMFCCFAVLLRNEITCTKNSWKFNSALAPPVFPKLRKCRPGKTN
jgi:hypothetical protein